MPTCPFTFIWILSIFSPLIFVIFSWFWMGGEESQVMMSTSLIYIENCVVIIYVVEIIGNSLNSYMCMFEVQQGVIDR